MVGTYVVISDEARTGSCCDVAYTGRDWPGCWGSIISRRSLVQSGVSSELVVPVAVPLVSFNTKAVCYYICNSSSGAL